MKPTANSRPHAQILVTGGAGYIGSFLVGKLLEEGYWVSVVDRLDFGAGPLLTFIPHPNFHFHLGDVTFAGTTRKVVEDAFAKGGPPLSAVVHLAAAVGYPACEEIGEEQSWLQNVEGVKRVFEESNELKAKRFIFSSTYSNYGKSGKDELVNEQSALYPQSIYAETKIAAEEFLLGSSDTFCAPLIFRFATLFGASPRTRMDLILNQFVLEAYLKGELMIYEPHYSRSFVHIQDVVAGIKLGLDAEELRIRGEIYNLGDESGNYTKGEVASMIQDVLPETKISYHDLNFDADMRNIRVSFEKIREGLNFKPMFTIEDGIVEMLQLLQSGLIEDPLSDKNRNSRSVIAERLG